MKIGITGTTGQLGRLVVEKMKQRVNSDNLVALVRSPEKAADLGIDARPFDYDNPEAILQGLNGIDNLLLISGSEIGQRKTQHKNIIEAAQKAGVKWIVYTSLLHADTSSLSLAKEHIETEKMLKDSGIPYTILRNGWYTENYMGSVSGALQAGVLIGSAGDGKISSAAREDFAEAAAVVLTSDKQIGKVYELAGDESYTLKDLAAEISKQTGKKIPYNNLSEDEHVEILNKQGLPEGLAQMLAGFDAGTSHNDLFDDGKELSRLIGRPTISLAEAVRRTLS
ncbi:SDR family oxidoreductase [Myroides indicus]|uniref:NAD(P)H dehydrogenase (Quinone) n=1 Tax=Myroides indicus TaxID=1323422 RepID=A0A4R7F8S1_9FLAO|nr:SDR family oxidoreductase [Myroides indicus]TDS63635.1 NAD(P)H dehydrogenase (quinone) [Myroides indicus]